MNIAQVLFPDGLPQDLAASGIVMPLAGRNTVIAIQDMMGVTRHRVDPVPMTDGRWVLSADVFSEARPDGLFPGVDHITPEMLDGVTVMPWADVLPLLALEIEP